MTELTTSADGRTVTLSGAGDHVVFSYVGGLGTGQIAMTGPLEVDRYPSHLR